MKGLFALLIAVFFYFNIAQASPINTYARFNNDKGDYVSGQVGFGSHGGLGLGATWERMWEEDISSGATFKFFQKNDNQSQYPEDFFFIGGFIRPHFVHKSWNFYLSPGLGFSQINYLKNTDTVLTLSMTIGVLFVHNHEWTFGVEHSDYQAAFNEDYGAFASDTLFIIRHEL